MDGACFVHASEFEPPPVSRKRTSPIKRVANEAPALKLVAIRAWRAPAVVVWMDSDGTTILALLENDRLQCLSFDQERDKTKLLWERRAPMVWTEHMAVAGELTVDWKRKLWFATCSSNDDVDAGSRVYLASFSLVTGAPLGRSEQVRGNGASFDIPIAADPARAMVWTVVSSPLLGQWAVSWWSYKDDGTVSAKLRTAKTLRLNVVVCSLSYDAARHTLVAIGMGSVVAIGTQSWSMRELGLPAKGRSKGLLARQGHLYMLFRHQIVQLTSSHTQRATASARLGMVGDAFAITNSGLIMVPAECRPETRSVPLPIPFPASRVRGRALLREVLHEVLGLPREVTQLVGSYHGWFLDRAPTVFRFRAPSEHAKTTRAFWDDEKGSLCFLTGDASRIFLRAISVLEKAGVESACNLSLEKNEYLCHFGPSGLWTRFWGAGGLVTRKNPETGQQISAFKPPTSKPTPSESNCVQIAHDELAHLILNSAAANVDVRSLSNPEKSFSIGVEPSQRYPVFSVAFAQTAQLFVWATGDNRLAVCFANAPLGFGLAAFFVFKAHWPVGPHDAVCLERANIDDCGLTAHPHAACTIASIKRVAVSDDAALIWLLIGPLVVAFRGQDILCSNILKNARAIHGDDLAMAAGLRAPWDIEDLSVDSVSGQVIVTGGCTVLSFPPRWFFMLARSLVVDRVIRANIS